MLFRSPDAEAQELGYKGAWYGSNPVNQVAPLVRWCLFNGLFYTKRRSMTKRSSKKMTGDTKKTRRKQGRRHGTGSIEQMVPPNQWSGNQKVKTARSDNQRPRVCNRGSRTKHEEDRRDIHVVFGHKPYFVLLQLVFYVRILQHHHEQKFLKDISHFQVSFGWLFLQEEYVYLLL